MAYIYKIKNLLNHKVYIGQTVQPIEKRFYQHKYLAKKIKENPSLLEEDRRYNMPIARAIAKYGIENFSFEIVLECDDSLLDEAEIYYIQYYNSFYDGYNATSGGQKCRKVSTIKEAEKDSICRDYSNGISLCQLSSDYSHTRETIKRVLLERKVAIRTFENGVMLMAIPKDKHSEVIKKYQLGYKISDISKKYKCSLESVRTVLHRYQIPIYRYCEVEQIDKKTGQILNCFENQSIAGKTMAERYGGSAKSIANHIRDCCRGKRKSCQGYKWRFHQNLENFI